MWTRSLCLTPVSLVGLGVLTALIMEQGPHEPDRDRGVSVGTQLGALMACGIAINAGVTEDDLTAHFGREEMERIPYKGLVEVLGLRLERAPFTPLSRTFWMCDYERIEDHGAYEDIVERLEFMTDSALGLADINDYVDIAEGKAWVASTYNGKRIRWDAEVEDDWMDPSIVVEYDQLLKHAHVDVRIYSNHTDYGQAALFAALTPIQLECLKQLSAIEFASIEPRI